VAGAGFEPATSRL